MRENLVLSLIGIFCSLLFLDWCMMMMSPVWNDSLVRPLAIENDGECKEGERYVESTIFSFCITDAEKEIELNSSEWADNSYDQCGKGSCK